MVVGGDEAVADDEAGAHPLLLAVAPADGDDDDRLACRLRELFDGAVFGFAPNRLGGREQGGSEQEQERQERMRHATDSDRRDRPEHGAIVR